MSLVVARYTCQVRRLIRILSYSVACMSLVLSVLALVFWVRSYFVDQYLIRKEPRDAQWVEMSRGELSVLVLRGADLGGLPLGSPAEWGWGTHSPTDLLPNPRSLPRGASPALFGFYVRRGSFSYGSSTKVVVPMSAVVVVLVLPADSLWRGSRLCARSRPRLSDCCP